MSELTVVEQRTVVFYDDEIPAVLVEEDGQTAVYVPVRPICDFLGITWSPQRRRVVRDPVLSTVMKGVTVRVTPGGQQEMLCLPVDYVSGFLFGISTLRVKEEIRERLILYQHECYKVLSEAFQEGRLTTDPAFDDLLETDSPAAQAYKMLRAMMKLAQNQLLLEARMGTVEGRIDSTETRLETIEAQLGSGDRYVSQSQAMQLSQTVKAIALELGKQTKRNEFGGVYGELYRRYEITSYKQLPASKFEAAMAWLVEWYVSLTGESPF